MQGSDIPVEVQARKADSRVSFVASMHSKFKSRRKLLFTGLPHICVEVYMY